jgi:hypothetical protein
VSTVHVTIALERLDAETLRAIDDLAKAKGVSRHDAARVLLGLGVEVLQRRRGT